MNRTTVAFLALAILLAHTLNIHQTPSGSFAAPYESAHVAFRLGRNLIHDGQAVWDSQVAWSESYPSPLWIGLAAFAEMIRVFPTMFAQGIGILSALLTIVVLAQFSPQRMAGLIAPVLLAASGSVAAAAASGTEAATAMALVTILFLAFERGWKRLFSLTMTLALLTRPEAVVLLLLLRFFESKDPPADEDGVPHRPLARAFYLPFAAVVVALGVRLMSFGTWLSPVAAASLEFDGDRIRLGFEYLASYVMASGSGPVLLLPIVFALFGRLRGTGRRALVLFLAWAGYVAFSGGDGLPFWNALAPTLPLAFLAIQLSITTWLDRLPRHASLAWGIVITTVIFSFLASKLPGNLGPLPAEKFISHWMEPRSGTRDAFPHALGRVGLLQEIRDVGHLRTAGLFLKEMIREDAQILTFWPGSIGYLARKHVTDLLGRANPAQGKSTGQTWRGQPRVDLVEALLQPAEYLIPAIDPAEKITITARLHGWLRCHDIVGDTPERFGELLHALRRFELVSVPVPLESANPNVLSPEAYLLLRDKSLGLAPTLEVRTRGHGFSVHVGHKGNQQVADLLVEFSEEGGRRWRLAPTGEWKEPVDLRARTNMLIYDTGSLPIRLIDGTPPAGAGPGVVTARLLTPGIGEQESFAAVAKPASAPFQ